MNTTRIIIALCFLVLIGVPLLFRPAREESLEGAPELIIVTPHNEQIRYEFGRAFSLWHERTFGEPVDVVWSTPGGTSEIRKMLQSQYIADLEQNRRDAEGDLVVGGNADLMFGGGSYEHSVLARPIEHDGRTTTISEPIEFDEAFLDEVYGTNKVGDDVLYDADHYWFGVALSGFGIVYNRDVLAELGVPAPVYWADLCDPRLLGWVALVNPGQSGSITTAFDAILQQRGWTDGWRILRRAGANARYFSASSPKAPIDVSLGDAAAGICIDFYGRYQSQAIKESGGGDRVGYVDPPGVTRIDADPISMLRGAVHPELAKRFVRFCLTETAQSLWQFPVGDEQDDRRVACPTCPAGPVKFELRRMPVRRLMYEKYFDHFLDQANPFEIARPFTHPNSDFRAFIAVVFAAMAMDNHDQLREAWKTIVEHPAYPNTSEIVTDEDVDNPALQRMLELFDAMPKVPGPDATRYSLAETKDIGKLKAGWLRGGWAGTNLWPAPASPEDVLRRNFGDLFRTNYEKIIALGENNT